MWPARKVDQENRRGDSFADIAALKKLARWCRRYSPIVGLEDAEMPEALFLDITDCAHLFGGEEALARRMLHDLVRMKLTARVTIADTIGAAWAATFMSARKNLRAPVVIPPGKQTLALRWLPVEALRLPATVVEVLREFDLLTIGQLLQLPRETLPSRFGSELLLRLDQALGRAPEMIAAEHFDEPVAIQWGCDDPIDNVLAIEAILKRLLRDVVRDVAARGEGILRLDISLMCVNEKLVRLSIGCLRPTLHCKHLMELIFLQLERLPLRQGVVDFVMRAADTAPRNESQPDLFGGREQRDNRRELDLLLNRLASSLGRAAVLRPVLYADHQPERAVRFRPVIGAAVTESRQAIIPCRRHRPVRLQSQPVPVTVVSVMPDGPPIRILRHNTDQRIVYCEGPERIETGWWREESVRRDYYRVETDGGERYWLFRDLDEEKWFLHGEF